MKAPALALLATLFGGCGPSSSHAPASTETAPQAEPPAQSFVPHEGLPAKVFRSPNGGITLQILYLQDVGQEHRALVRFTGVQHPMVGKVLLASHTGTSETLFWTTRYDGKDYVVVREALRSLGTDAILQVALVLPRTELSMQLEYQHEASLELDTDEMVRAHRKALADNSLAKLQAVDRPYHTQLEEKRLARIQDDLDNACRTAIPIETDWKSFSDTDIAAASPCPVALRQIKTACVRDSSSRATFVRRVERVVCAVGSETRIELGEDKVLRFTISSDNRLRSREAYDEVHDLLELTRTVVQNARGQFLVFDPDVKTDGSSTYFGDGERMYRLNPGNFALGVWGPIDETRLKHSEDEDGWLAVCSLQRSVKFHPVDDATRLKVLAAKYIDEPIWKRTALYLARDDKGMYYYVDQYREEFGGKNYRVFRGPRGQAVQTTLTDIVDDSSGMIFATKEGKLRLILGKDKTTEASWIEGKKRKSLILLPPKANRRLIYSGLGVYDSDDMGIICQ